MAKPGREVIQAPGGVAVPVRALRRLGPRLGGARLCYGKPVRSGEVTVIPVASVRGGLGFGYGQGSNPDRTEEGGGGGGGGGIDAKPVGFIEVTPAGTRFRRIADVEGTLRGIGRLAVGLAVAATILGRRERGWRPRAYAALLTRRR